MFFLVNTLMEELRPVFANAARKNILKEELLVALQLKCRECPIKNEPFRKMLNGFISRESLDQCSIALTAPELSSLWNG